MKFVDGSVHLPRAPNVIEVSHVYLHTCLQLSDSVLEYSIRASFLVVLVLLESFLVLLQLLRGVLFYVVQDEVIE
jgi:hypothetical protein